MMAYDLDALAAAFKSAINEKREAQKRAREEEAQRLANEAARKKAHKQAVKGLMKQLAGFGKAIGHIEVAATAKEVTFRFGDAEVKFRPDDEEVGVTFAGATDRDALIFDEGNWSLRRQVDDRFHYYPLLPDGLQHLMVEILGLPSPSGGPTPAESRSVPAPAEKATARPAPANKSTSTKRPSPGSGVTTLSNPWD